MGSGAVKTSNEVQKVFPVYQFPIGLTEAFWFVQVPQSLGDVRPVRAETIFSDQLICVSRSGQSGLVYTAI